MSTNSLPLLQHALESPSAFTPERLMEAVRAERSLANEPVPPLCVLDFDGDLSDGLAEEGRTSPVKSWACFHTSMRAMTFVVLTFAGAATLWAAIADDMGVSLIVIANALRLLRR